jgi:toxin ParE1/3/4
VKIYDVKLTDTVDADFGEIFDYIAAVLMEPVTAGKLVDRMYKACQSLEKLPYIYPLSRDSFLASQGFRVMPVGNYLVFYTVDEDKSQVVVHRAIYGKRNYRALFSKPPDGGNGANS